MGKRGPSAQYAYGITIEAGNYNEVINGFEKRLKNLDKVTTTTTKTFAALSEAMKSGKQVDFSKAEGQLTGLVTEMEEVAKWREQLAGGQKLSDMFDGLDQVKQSLGQVTSQLDKFGDNIEEIFSILQNVPQNTSKTFVDVRKVLQRQASDMSKIIAELNNPTEKTDVSALKNQLSGLATDFVNEWNKATSQGIKMDQVVDFKPFANIIKTAISGARSLGAEFNDVSASVTEATKNVVALYNVKHPTGMFKDLTSGLSSVESQAKRTEQAASKAVASFKATIGIVDKLNKSDMGLSKNSKEMEEFLAKLQNPEITVKINKKDPDNVIDTFYALQDKVDELAGGSVLNLTQDFFKDIPVEKLKELGDALQNIIAIGNHKDYKKILNFGDDVFGTGHFSGQIKGYSSDLEQVMTELESRLNEAKQSVQDLSNTLQQMVEKAGLKEIKVELGIKDDINYYVEKINSVITDIEKQANRIKKIPVTLAFDDKKDDKNKENAEALKNKLTDLKEAIHKSRTEIEGDLRSIKEAVNGIFKSSSNSAAENLFNSIQNYFDVSDGIDVYINDEALIKKIEDVLTGHQFNININPNVNGNAIPINGSLVGVGGKSGNSSVAPIVPVAQTSESQALQEKALKHTAESSEKAAEHNDTTSLYIEKASGEFLKFIQSFNRSFNTANKKLTDANVTIANGGQVDERRLRSMTTRVSNLSPMYEYLSKLFNQTDLAKISKNDIKNIITELIKKNEGKSGFKGETFLDDILRQGKIGKSLTAKLDTFAGKDKTIDMLFKSLGLESIDKAIAGRRDDLSKDNGQNLLKYYQKYGKIGDLVDQIVGFMYADKKSGMDKVDIDSTVDSLEDSLKKLKDVFPDISSKAKTNEQKTSVKTIEETIDSLTTLISNYKSTLSETGGIPSGENIYTHIQNGFSRLFETISNDEKDSIIKSFYGKDPTKDAIKPEYISSLKDAIQTVSGNDETAGVVNVLTSWLDRLDLRNQVLISVEDLQKQLINSKVSRSIDGRREVSVRSLVNDVLKQLDADIVYETKNGAEKTESVHYGLGRGNSSRKKRDLLNKVTSDGVYISHKTQFYDRNNKRPTQAQSRVDLNGLTKNSNIDWEKRIVESEKVIQEKTKALEEAKKVRDEKLADIAKREESVGTTLDKAQKELETAKANLDEVTYSTSDLTDSSVIFSLNEEYKKQAKIYDSMKGYAKKNIASSDLLKDKNISPEFKSLMIQKEQIVKKMSSIKKDITSFKTIEELSPERLDAVISQNKQEEARLNDEISRINNELSEISNADKESLIKSLNSQIEQKKQERKIYADRLRDLKKASDNGDVEAQKESDDLKKKIFVLNEQIDSLSSKSDIVNKNGSPLKQELKTKQEELSIIQERLKKQREVKEKGKISSDLESQYKEEEQNLQNITAEINIVIDNQAEEMNSISINKMKEIASQYKKIKKTLPGLNKELKKQKKGTVEYDKIWEQINSIKTYMNSMFDEFENIGKQIGLDDDSMHSIFSSSKKSYFKKQKVGTSITGKYKEEIKKKQYDYGTANKDKTSLEEERAEAEKIVAEIEKQIKIEKRRQELAQANVEYTKKKAEEYDIVQEISKLENNPTSVDLLNQKRQELSAIGEELKNIQLKIVDLGGSKPIGVLDDTLDPGQKKVEVLKTIKVLQEEIIKNQARIDSTEQSIETTKALTVDKNNGGIVSLSGRRTAKTQEIMSGFIGAYTATDDYKGKVSVERNKFESSLSDIYRTMSSNIAKGITSLIEENMGSIAEKRYGKSGIKAHKQSFDLAMEKFVEKTEERLSKKIKQIQDEYFKYVESIESSDLSETDKKKKIDIATAEMNSKTSAESQKRAFNEIVNSEASKFLDNYYEYLSWLIEQTTGKSIDVKSLRKEQRKIKSSDITKIYDQYSAEAESTRANLEKKQRENIDAILRDYIKSIKKVEPILDGVNPDLPNDIIFEDAIGNRVNVTKNDRNRNESAKQRIKVLKGENASYTKKIQNWMSQYDISDLELEMIDDAIKLAMNPTDKNLQILFGKFDPNKVDTTPIEEATTSIANQTIKAAAETAKKAADDKLSTLTVPETAPVQQAEQKVAEQVVESVAQSAKESVSKESKTTTKTSAEYKDAIKIVKEAIGSFRGRTDKSKAEFYGTLGKEVKDAANLIYRTPAENRTKEGNALLNKMMELKNATQEKQKQTAEEIKQTTEKQKQTAEEVKQTAEQQKQVELSDAEKLKLAKKELQNRIDTAKEIAQDGTKSKSKEVIKSGSVPSAQNPEYVFNEGVESTSEFVKEVWNLTEAFKAGANAANIEYGFATQSGKRIQLAKGDNGSVDFQRFYGDVDSLTHSHSYTKGLNNMVFSLEDINQLAQLGTRNNLKKYNLIYDNEMMSLNLGKNSKEAAEAIADCYPQINDVVMAMLSREDGNSIPAENSDEMARILNGYLQKVVEDAGGRLSVVNSKGESVTSKYSITDDEYSKLNNILAKSQNYYNDNFGTVSKSDYVSVIRQYIAEEFGKEFMANVRAKSDTNPHGGVYTEFSAIPEYDDEDKKMLDYAEQVTLYSKKIVAAEKAFVESLQKMSNEDLMAFIKQGEETLGIKKEPEIKPTLTKAQIAALNPDDVTALQKTSIKQFSKIRNWNENNVGNIEGLLGIDNKTLAAYKIQFEELAKIALDLKTKGESGTIITKDDISQLDAAISKTKELQTTLTKEAQFKQMKDAGLIVNGKTKIKSTDGYSERQEIMAQYAKKYAAQNKSEYQFGQYDFINDKISFDMVDSAGKVTKVIMGWSDAFNTAYIQSSKLQGSLDKITQEVYKTDEAIKAGEEYGFFQEQSDGIKAYKDALAEYEAQVKAVSKSSQKDLAENFEKLHAAQEKVVNAGKDLLDKQKDAYGFNNAQKVIGRAGNIDAVLQNYRDQGINVNDIELVRNYNDAMGDLNQKIEELKKNGKLWDAQEQPGLKLLTDRAIEAEKALLKADEAQRQLKGDLIKGDKARFFEDVDVNDVEQVKQAMTQYALSIKGVDAQSIKWNEDQQTLSYSVRNGKHEISDFTVGMRDLTNEFYAARTGTRTVQTGMEAFLSSIGDKLKEVGRYILSFGSFYRIWGEIQKGVTYVREIDSALTELKKVTDETDATYAKFLKTMSQTGAEVGATVKDLTNMAANWARLGYSIEEAGELARSTAVLLNVSEFTDADTASEALISTMQAYGYAAEDSMHVVDVLNEIGNNFAISSDGIATALQDSASSLMAAGNNLEQSVAMIAAANKVLQDPNSVGSALRTISLRIRGTSTKVLEELGEETDGVIESVSKLQDKVKGLSGVDILTDTGAYKDTYTIIKEIAQVWDKMNDIDRAALLELLAGKNRSNAMAALLTNLEDLEGAYESAMEAQGSAEAENEKYMNSIQGKIEQFTNALQTMWSKTIKSSIVKWLVGAGTAIVKFVSQIGMIPTALAGVLVYFTAIKKNNPINLFKDAVNTIRDFSAAANSISNLSKAGIAFNSDNIDIYSAAIADLTAKQQALVLSSAGLTKQQAAEVMTKNGCSDATIQQAMAEASLANAKTRTSAKTGEEIFNIIAETNVKLSDEATTWLVTHATDELTAAKIRAAIASGELSKAEGESIIAMAGFSTGIKGLGKSLKALFLNNPVGWVLTAISAFTMLSSAIKESEKKIKDSADSIVKAYNEAQDTIANNQNTISSISSQYQILSRGVNELGENVSLSTKEYEEYKNIVSQIESMFPSMVAGYNNEGVAILTCKGNVDELTKAYEENAKAAYAAAVAGQGDVWKSFEGSFWSKWNGKTDLEKQNEAAKRLKEYLTMDESGIRYIDTINFDSSDETNDWIVQLLEKAGFSQGNQTKEEFIKNTINQNIKAVNSLINQAINSYESSANPVKTILDAWLHTDQSDYSELSDSAKSTIRKVINGFSTDFIRSFDSITDIESYISQIIDSFKDKNVSDALNSFLEIDENKISLTNYQDLIHKLEESLQKAGINEDVVAQIKIGLKIDETSLTTDINHIKSLLGDKVDDIDSKINSLSVKDIQIAGEIPTTTLNSWDELIEKIKEAKVANIGDFNISDYSDSISSLSENIGVLQDALEKLNSGSFTMDDYVKLIKDFPKLAKGVDVSSKSFKGLTSNLVRAIKASPKSMVKDLKALKLQLMQTGRSTSDIDQLIYSLEHMPENALNSMIAKYETLAEKIKDATEAQLELKAAMEENPNEGFETRGEAMDYMKEAMSRGEIGSESNLWNVAEKYGFTFDSAKSINENADALAKFIATREKWFKQDDDGNYTYEGTEDFIKKVDTAVASMPELQELMKWDYNENTGVLDFDFKNKDWDQIVKYLSTCEGLIGLTSDEWADMLVQVGQYFNIDWSNYNDELEYLKKITTEDTDNKSKVEKYGSAMQEYFGKDSSIDLANRPMVSSSKMKAKGWDVEDGSYATVLSGAYSNEGETAAITVTPILPDGEVLTEEELTKYATEIVNGADPATYEFEVNGKTYTGEDIILAKHNGKNPIEEAKEYGQALHEAQEEYDKLRDTLNINTTIDEKGIEGLSEIKEIQNSISKQSDGTVIIDENAFRKALTSAEYTEDQIDLIVDKIKTLNKEAFTSDSFNIGKILDKETGSGIDGLLEIKELQDAIKKDANTGFTVLDTDMFTSVLSEAGYTKAQIDELIQKIQEYEGIVSVSGNTDPLGLNSTGLSIDSLKASLSTLGVFFEDNLGDWFDGKRDLKINVPDLVSTLKEKGWSEEAIRSYCEQLSQANIEGFNIKVNSQEIDEALAKSEDVPEEKSTNYEVTGDGATTLENIDNKWGEVTQDKTTNYTIVETTVKKTVEEDDSEANGTAVWYKPWTWFSSADGTANAQGNWGVAQDETSLVGELGTELLVRNGKWTTIGENGAEFANIKKGDIIFNHKQTEELLKNGHISSRGKAYANGTAYVVGNSAFARYGFSGNGGYQKFDVNGNVVDTFGNAANAISDAADSMSDAADKFDETIDWFEILLEEIESDISLMNAQLENAVGRSAKKGIYSQILNAEHYKVQELNEGIKLYSDYSAKLLAKIPEQYREMAKNGAVAIKEFVGEENEEVVEAINNYREWANKVKDLNQQLEETKKQISETRVQIQEMVKTEYDNEIGLITVKNDQIQGEMSLQEEKGERSSDVYYEAMTKNSKEQLSKLKAQRKEMQAELDKAVKSGDVKKFSDDWYTMVNAIYDVDAAIIDCETDIEGYQNSMNDLHWDNFEKIITEIDNVRDEGEQLRSLIDDDDIADDVGNWTDAGITSIGLLAQEMENAKYRAELYGKEIEQLNKDYKAGKYSTDEYNEKLKDLKDSQWDSIDAYESAKKAIIDANKTRIEAVKDGIQKEIDAYDKLISKRKEDLSAQKDAHDFNKNVQDQQKEIDKIQRQLDAMEGDNSAAANAKRKKLQEELYQAQSDLAETYYDHDIETQQKALDDELEAYKQEKEDRMEELDKYLENEEQVLADSLQLILDNADGIDSFLKNISEKYGVSIYDAVVDPWSDGADALSKYLEMLKGLKGEQEGIQKGADKNAKDTVDKINKSTKDTTSAEYVEPKPEPKPSKPSHSSGGSYYAPSSVGVGSAVTVKSSATNFSRDGGNGTKMQGWVPGSTFTVMETSGDQVLIGIPGSGYTGWVNKSDLEGFAKGTKGVKSSQLAMIDENGLEELVLHADGNGKLAFLSKGTSVIPADITENLMKLGSIDPTEMLKRNTPSIGAPHITNNNMELNLEFGSLVHVDNCNQDTIPELQKMVRSEFDNMMKQVNSGLKRYAR